MENAGAATVILAIVIIAAITVALIMTSSKPPYYTGFSRDHSRARHSGTPEHRRNPTLSSPLPDSWDWYQIGHEQSAWFETHRGAPLPTGKYTTEVMNQHLPAYCGSCYLMSSVQMMADRFHIMQGVEQRLDVQEAMDRYLSLRGWNPCMGGDPVTFLRTIGHLVGSDSAYRAVACTAATTQAREFRIESAHDWQGKSVDFVKARIALFGPVLLAVDALPLMAAEFRGTVTRCSRGKVDHMVCVVGWRSDDTWIVRNTWGADPSQPQYSPPSDISCLTTCAVAPCAQRKTFHWHGLADRPGYFLLPFRCARADWFDAVPEGWQARFAS